MLLAFLFSWQQYRNTNVKTVQSHLGLSLNDLFSAHHHHLHNHHDLAHHQPWPLFISSAFLHSADRSFTDPTNHAAFRTRYLQDSLYFCFNIHEPKVRKMSFKLNRPFAARDHADGTKCAILERKRMWLQGKTHLIRKVWFFFVLHKNCGVLHILLRSTVAYFVPCHLSRQKSYYFRKK